MRSSRSEFGSSGSARRLGREPGAIELAPQFSVTVDRTLEAAEARYLKSGPVAHWQSLAYTGRDLSRQVEANLVGSPDVILEKVARLDAIGVDHCAAPMFSRRTPSRRCSSRCRGSPRPSSAGTS